MPTLPELFNVLATDAGRLRRPFSADISSCTDELLSLTDDVAAAKCLQNWLMRYQPCLFGRLAAKSDALTFCFVRESDIAEGDLHVRAKIQSKRLGWWRTATAGKASGFVVLVLSDKVVRATPDQALARVAQRIAELYLIEEKIELNKIYLDQVFLEIPNSAHTVYRWQAGVNYFCANADGRWWHDHRIPGGFAFSVNSVGHLIKSNLVNKTLEEFRASFEDATHAKSLPRLTDLSVALEFAMRTIELGASTSSGKATWLLDASETCPVALPDHLSRKNCHRYAGHYHTDQTLPRCYFKPTWRRPKGLKEIDLDFTYLFKDSVENPAFATMGIGQQIRAGIDELRPAARSGLEPTIVPLVDYPGLERALSFAR